MKKNWASIAKVTTSAIRFAPMKLRLANSLNSTIGARTLSSTRTNAASIVTEPPSKARIAVEPHPHEFPSISARTSAVRPAVSVATPA